MVPINIAATETEVESAVSGAGNGTHVLPLSTDCINVTDVAPTGLLKVSL